MADLLLSFKLDGEKYDVHSPTLADAMLIHREFGVSNLEGYTDWTSTPYIAAVTYLAFREKNRFLTHDQIMQKVGAVDFADLAGSIVDAMVSDVEAAQVKAQKKAEADEAKAVARPPTPAKVRAAAKRSTPET